MKLYLDWNDVRVGRWDSNPFTWDEVFILEEIFSGGTDGHNPYDVHQNINGKSEEKKKKIIKIIAKLEGKEFKEEKYQNKKIKVTVKDVKILFESLNIKVNV
jgi:hypothetical protein